MTFTLSKKDLMYWIAICLLTIAFGASFVAYRAVAQDTSNLELTQEQYSQSDSDDTNLLFGLGSQTSVDIEHLACSGQMVYSDLPESNTYDPNSPFTASFMGNGAHFQDLNGDNLVDYAYIFQNLASNGENLTSEYRSCIYLHTGSGWERAYICSAETVANINTGQQVSGTYRGDCAAGASANKLSE